MPDVTNTGRRPFAAGVHLVAGSLLMFAAVLKAYSAATALPGIALHLRLFDLALIEFELAVGGILLLGRPLARRRPKVAYSAWGLATLAFTVFAGVSLRKALAGAKSCGCFGPAAVDPRLMTAIDIILVVLLLLAGPRTAAASSAPSSPRRPLAERAGVFAMVAIVALMLLSAAGVGFAAWPKRGLVAVENGGRYDFGIIPAADAARCQHTFLLRNTSARPLNITGSSSSCRCTVADVPTYRSIAPGGSVSITVRADWSDGAGPTTSTFTLQTDSFWTPKVPLTLGGDVRGAAGEH
jgi:Protein of unknown function (DUF1573)/Methylamine utilisation protein MauE